MKLIPFFALFALFQSFALILSANVEFLFDDADGSAVTSALNTGSTSGSWSPDSPLLVDGGSLNIGYTANNKSTHVNSNNTLDSFSLGTALNTGKHIFEAVISAHDISSSWNNPEGLVSFEKIAKFALESSNGTGSEIGIRGFWNLGTQTTNLYIYSDDSNGNASVNKVELNIASDPTLVMGVAPITFQIEVDLDNGGIWTARAKWGADGDWVDLTQNGAGLSDISNINIQTSYNNFSWGSDTADGTASDYLEVDSITLTEDNPVVYSGIKINSQTFGKQTDRDTTTIDESLFIEGTETTIQLADETDQKNDTDELIFQIAADLVTGDWSSRYKIGENAWNPLVTDGKGMTSIKKFQIQTLADGTWGDQYGAGASPGDFVKIDSIKLLNGSNLSDDGESFDVATNDPLIDFSFNDVAGSVLKASDPTSQNVIESSGSQEGAFNTGGHITDGTNLVIGHSGDGYGWLYDMTDSFRSYDLVSPIEATQGAVSDVKVFEIRISSYDLSNSWDGSTQGSYSNKGVKFILQKNKPDDSIDSNGGAINNTEKGASITLATTNKLLPNTYIQLDFDDEKAQNLSESVPIFATGFDGSWDFGGPFTSGVDEAGNGVLNIGYTANNFWKGVDTPANDKDRGSNVMRTFRIDDDPETPGLQPISGDRRIVIEASFSEADLRSSWLNREDDPNTLMQDESVEDYFFPNKGVQIIVRKAGPDFVTDGDDKYGGGAMINLYSHIGNNENKPWDHYQLKVQSNKWDAQNLTSEYQTNGVLAQNFGLGTSGAIDVQIRINTFTGEWTSHVKPKHKEWDSSDVIDLEKNGTGFDNIAAVTINAKTTLQSSGIEDDPDTSRDERTSGDDPLTTDIVEDNFYPIWGNDDLNTGAAPEDFEDLNGNLLFDAGIVKKSSEFNSFTQDEFTNSINWNFAGQNAVGINTVTSLPDNATLVITSDGINANLSWNVDDIDLQSKTSLDESEWSNEITNGTTHSEPISDSKFFRLHISASDGNDEQTIVLNVVDSFGADPLPTYTIHETINGVKSAITSSVALAVGTNTIVVPANSNQNERDLEIEFSQDFLFSELSLNGSKLYDGEDSEPFVDADGNLSRFAGTPRTAGDYVLLDYIRVSSDLAPDTNYDIVLISDKYGAASATPNTKESTGNVDDPNTAEDESLRDNPDGGERLGIYSQKTTNSPIYLKMTVDLDSQNGEWSTQYSTNDTDWTNLVTDGEGITKISNIVMNVRRNIHDSWGKFIGGTDAVAGDFIGIDSIILSKVGIEEPIVSYEFYDGTETVTSNGENTVKFKNAVLKVAENDANNAPVGNQNLTVNTGTDNGVWSAGGPNTAVDPNANDDNGDGVKDDGILYVGDPKYYKFNDLKREAWPNGGEGSNVYRKYTLDTPITDGLVELKIVISDFDLSRSWDNNDPYNGRSMSDKGINFMLLSDPNLSATDTTEGAVIKFYTIADASPTDMDGDGIPDYGEKDDEFVLDPYNGEGAPGVYTNIQFSDDNNLSATADSGSMYWNAVWDPFKNSNGQGGGPNWNFGGPNAKNGVLNIGYSPNARWEGIYSNPHQGWRKKFLFTEGEPTELTKDTTISENGVVVFEAAISGYDLDRSWDTEERSEANKGFKFVLTNGNSTGDQQGPIVALSTTKTTDENGAFVYGVEAYSSVFYGGDRIVFSEGDVRKDLNNASQSSDDALVFQIVCDLNSGLWYSRYKVGSADWDFLTKYGANFKDISNIRISHSAISKTGDNWAPSKTYDGTDGDYVLIDYIKLGDRDVIDDTIPLPSDLERPASADILVDKTTEELRQLDPDQDGRIDQFEEYATGSYENDTDNDGENNDEDTDDDGDGTPDIDDAEPLNPNVP